MQRSTPKPSPDLAAALNVPATEQPSLIAQSAAIGADEAGALGRAYAVLLERRRARLAAQNEAGRALTPTKAENAPGARKHAA
jgi:hypothetical protein